MNGTNRQAEGGKKHETEQSTPMRRESAKKFCATWMGMTIGFAFMMSSIDVHRAVGLGVVCLTTIHSNSEKHAQTGMGRFLIALVGTMGLALVGVYGGGDALATKYPLLQNLLVVALTICWIVGLTFDYRRWRKQSEAMLREHELSATNKMSLPEHGTKHEADA